MESYDEFSYSMTAYMRVASIAVAAYSLLETAPSVWKFYRDQLRLGRLTISCIMLFLIQFSSIMALTISNFGFFYPYFTKKSCDRYYLLPSVFKVFQVMVSQLILGIRAFNLSTRSKRIGLLLIVVYTATCVVEWVATFYRRIATVDPHYGNCRGVFHVSNSRPDPWVYYLAAMLYDLAVTVISVGYLFKHATTLSRTMMSKLTRMMMYDGIGYFVFLTGVNVVNLMIYRENPDIQTAAASLGYAATWIFTQRLLIHLHEMSLDRRNDNMYEAYKISQTISSAQAVSRAVRSQFEPKGVLPDSLELTNPDFDLDTLEAGNGCSDDVSDVQVHVERTVTLHRRPTNADRERGLEDYSRHAISAITNATHETRTISIVSSGRKP